MTERQIAPYGSWKSPITSDLIVRESIGLTQVKIDGNDIYWIEMRPSEGGRQVIVRYSSGSDARDINQREFNARTRVHEYGGGEYAVAQGDVYFSNFADQQLYRQSNGSAPKLISTEGGDTRYADAVVDSRRQRLVCVFEDHRDSGEAVNAIASVPIDGGSTTILISGNNFYSSPQISPDGSRLAWLTWNHPNMPWDGCELWVGNISDDGSIANRRLVAGGPNESIFQPEWSPDGILHFVSDRSGWWNLYRLRAENETECLCDMPAEFGAPQWVFGLSTYAFDSSTRIVCAFVEQGIWRLGTIDTTSRALRRIDLPFTEISFVRAAAGCAVFRAGSPRESFAIIELDLATGSYRTLQRATQVTIEPGYVSEALPIEFPTENGLTAHGFYYPPANQDFAAPENDRPLLLVKSHGGPTSATIAVFMLSIQYWTSRGIAVLDVNYGGSTGYGRA